MLGDVIPEQALEGAPRRINLGGGHEQIACLGQCCTWNSGRRLAAELVHGDAERGGVFGERRAGPDTPHLVVIDRSATYPCPLDQIADL